MTKAPDVLVADIGGTNSRFALSSAEGARDRLSVANDDVDSLETAISRYLGINGARPRHAVLAVAAPVRGRKLTLTNRNWVIDAAALERRFGFTHVELINDFAAVAHALPTLTAAQVHRIGDAPFGVGLTKVVLGPGTGLGVAALIHDGGVWRALPSEGGHIEFAPMSDLEAEVFARLKPRLGRVSAECVVSGMGLRDMDLALAGIEGVAAEPRRGSQIEAAARAGEARAQKVMDIFCDALARFAGDMAVTFVAQGGIYIGGGIAPKIADRIDAARFRSIFEAKAPHRKLMAEIGTGIILERDPGLEGCVAYALQKYT